MMFCPDCTSELQNTWAFCPTCGYEIDKAGSLDKLTLREFLDQRKKTLDVLERVIRDLERYGKLDATSSILASGTNIASAILWLTMPGNPVAVAVHTAASGLRMANFGVSVLTTWKENGLLNEANEVLKLDHQYMKRFGMVIPWMEELMGKYKDLPTLFCKTVGELNVIYEGSNSQEYSIRPTISEARNSFLGNFAVFLTRACRLYQGNYSKVAEKLEAEMVKLQDEYDVFKPVPGTVLADAWKK